MVKVIYKVLIMLDERQSQLSPLVAFIGGLVSQEIVKAITQKFIPVKQLAIYSFSEFIDDIQPEKIEKAKQILEHVSSRLEGASDEALKKAENIPEQYRINLLGKSLYEKVKNCKLFMIGAGAIGCELLKNYAMLGVGTGEQGKIILTDPDVIEVSNLNR